MKISLKPRPKTWICWCYEIRPEHQPYCFRCRDWKRENSMELHAQGYAGMLMRYPIIRHER